MTRLRAWLSRWKFMRHQRIADKDDIYLDRFEILTTPWFGIKLHRIYRPDKQRDVHSHPWPFVSFILLGSYVEYTYDADTGDLDVHRCAWINTKGLRQYHTITSVSRRPVWTLVFHGRKQQTWGFLTKDGLKAWYDYEKLETP